MTLTFGLEPAHTVRLSMTRSTRRRRRVRAWEAAFDIACRTSAATYHRVKDIMLCINAK